MNAKKSVLVVGGNGFIGGAFVRESVDRFRVFVLDSDLALHEYTPCSKQVIAKKVQLPEIFDVIPIKIDIILYAAGRMVPGTSIIAENVAHLLSNDLVRVMELAIHAKNSGVSRFIYLSSGGAIYEEKTDIKGAVPFLESDKLEPITFYGVTKIAVESYLRVLSSDDFSVLCLRLANPYSYIKKENESQGVIPIIISKIMAGQVFYIYGSGSNIRDYIHIDDVVAALQAACTYHGSHSCLNIGTGVGVSLLELIGIIEAYTHKKLECVFLPERGVDKEYAVISPELAMKELAWCAKVDVFSGIEHCINLLSSD